MKDVDKKKDIEKWFAYKLSLYSTSPKRWHDFRNCDMASHIDDMYNPLDIICKVISHMTSLLYNHFH